MICVGNGNAGLFHSPSTSRFDFFFLKEEAAHIIRHIFFKSQGWGGWVWGALRGVDPRDAGFLAPTSDNACASMCKHAGACVKGDHTEEGPLRAN